MDKLVNETEIDAEKELGAPIQHGRSSELFDWEKGQVLKLYFAEYPEKSVDLEYSNTVEAFNAGATPMKVYGKVKIGDRFGIIMDRLDGITMNDAPAKCPSVLFKAGKILSDEHVKLQKCHSDGLPDIKDVACKCLDDKSIFDFLSGEEIAKAKAYISALPSDNTFLHLDFHTGNVLINPKTKETVVIDWMTGVKGRPEAEAAMMTFLFNEAELFPGSSKLELLFYTLVRKSIGKSFMKNYFASTGMKRGDVDKWYIVAIIIRLGLWNIAFEKPYISAEIKKRIAAM